MSTSNIIVTVIVAVLSSTGLWAFLDNIRSDSKAEKARKEEMAKREELKEQKIDEIMNEVKNLSNQVNQTTRELKAEIVVTKELGKSEARATLNKWCEKFLTLGYIPRCYYTAFKSLGESYQEAGGNSEVGDKFDYLMENLEVK